MDNINKEKIATNLAKRIINFNKSGTKAEPIIRKTISELEKLRAVKELKNLGVNSYSEVAAQARSALEKMLPEFIENDDASELQYLAEHAALEIRIRAVSALGIAKAKEELKYIGEYVTAYPEIAKQAVSTLEKLKAVSELGYLRYNAAPEIKEQAKSALEKLNLTQSIR